MRTINYILYLIIYWVSCPVILLTRIIYSISTIGYIILGLYYIFGVNVPSFLRNAVIILLLTSLFTFIIDILYKKYISSLTNDRIYF